VELTRNLPRNGEVLAEPARRHRQADRAPYRRHILLACLHTRTHTRFFTVVSKLCNVIIAIGKHQQLRYVECMYCWLMHVLACMHTRTHTRFFTVVSKLCNVIIAIGKHQQLRYVECMYCWLMHVI
jgi:hypothetical protein